MKLKVRLCTVFAAAALAAVCSGCDESSFPVIPDHVPPETSAQSSEAQENAEPEPTEPSAPADQPSAEAVPADDAPQPAADDPDAVLCGKWEVYSVDDQTVCGGQYGDEDYARLWQMELLANGTALYYDRMDGRVVNIGWTHPVPDFVQLTFGADQMPFMFPLSFNEGAWDCSREGWLTGVSESGMQVALRKTDSFQERAYPQSANLAGLWSGSANGAEYGWDISTVEQSVLLNITVNGEGMMYPYFGEVQSDGSIRLIVEFGDGTPQPFEQSVIVSSDGRTAQWTTENGTVTMTKSASAV
ncbi:MAG: hypothetical protein MJ065_03000 [Oscillospiraceae bacterium]|nr:hypothetical protein [Oscillospiraceae bacterium]